MFSSIAKAEPTKWGRGGDQELQFCSNHYPKLQFTTNAVLWIRTHFGSVFRNLVDPDP